MEKSFPSDKDIQRIKESEEYKKLFDGLHDLVFNISDFFQKDLEKKRTLYVAMNLPAFISEYYADMIVGSGVFFDVEDKDIQEKINEFVKRNGLDVLLYEASLAQSEYGYVPIRLRIENKEVIIEQIPNDQYFPDWSNDIKPVLNGVTLASYVEIGNGDEGEMFLYKEIYTKENNDKVYLEYQLWSVDSDGKQKTQVSTSKFNADLPEGKQLTLFTEYPIYQINNIKTSDDNFGRSDYYNIYPQLKSINETITQIHIELRKNLYSRIAVPQGTLNDNGEIRASEADIFEVGVGDKMPQYIQKSNPLIEEAFREIEFFVRSIASMTKIPVEAFGIEGKGGVEKVEAMRLRLFNTEKKVQRKRVYFEKQLEDMLSVALAVEGTKGASVNITWDDILPVSELELTELLAMQVSSKLKSKRKAIKELQGLDDDLLDAEIEEINNEQTVSTNSITEPTQPLTFQDINQI
jgi:hypothetical protein